MGRTKTKTALKVLNTRSGESAKSNRAQSDKKLSWSHDKHHTETEDRSNPAPRKYRTTRRTTQGAKSEEKRPHSPRKVAKGSAKRGKKDTHTPPPPETEPYSAMEEYTERATTAATTTYGATEYGTATEQDLPMPRPRQNVMILCLILFGILAIGVGVILYLLF